MKHKNAWKALFKANEVPPLITEDRGLHTARQPTQVSSKAATGFGSSQCTHGEFLSDCVYLFQEYVETAERIDSPAPLPENPANDLLTKMLVPAPYNVPEKKAEKKAPGTQKGLRHKVVPEASSEDDEAHSFPKEEGE